MSAQLRVHDLSFSHGPLPLLSGVELTVSPSDRIGVIGPNGSGKSTLLRLMAGFLDPHSGSVFTNPPDAAVVMLAQAISAEPASTGVSWLEEQTGVARVQQRFDSAASAVAAGEQGAADRYDAALAALLRADPDSFTNRAEAAALGIGLDPVVLQQQIVTMSGGQRTKLKLVAVQLSAADILLLDEPTNDLDAQGLEALESALTDRQGATVVVSHDRAFLERFVNAVVELDDYSGDLRRFDGGYEAWQQERDSQRRRSEQEFEAWQSERAALKQRAARQREWSRRGEAAIRRGDEPDRNIRMAKIERAQKLGSGASTTERALARHDANRAEKPWDRWELRLAFPDADRSGDVVAELIGAVVERGDFRLGPVDLSLAQGDRVLVQGPNGGGKTTLIASLFGELELLSGQARVGRSVGVGWMSQGRDEFGAGPLLDAFVAAAGVSAVDARSQLAKLGIDADRSLRSVDGLSPGEVTRATLGLFAATAVNTLVLDEPTNHLDLEAIEQLELALGRFGGTVVLITHDRRLAEAFEHNRIWRVEAGRVVEAL